MSRSIPALAAALICGGPLSHFAQGQDSGPSSTVPAFPAESSITVFQVTPAAGADNTQSAPWAAKVRLWFLNPHAQVTTWGPLVKEGNTFSINFEAVQPSGDSGSGDPAGGIIAPGVTHERTYTLGILAPGPYKINLTSRGRLIREKSFTVGPPPPGDEVRAHVTLTVDPSDPNAVKARAHVEFEGYFHRGGTTPGAPRCHRALHPRGSGRARRGDCDFPAASVSRGRPRLRTGRSACGKSRGGL